MSKKVPTFDIMVEINMPENVLSKTKAKEFKQLSQKKERDRVGLFLAEGEKCVSDLLGAFIPAYLLCTKSWLKDHQVIKEEWGDKILLADHKTLELVSGLNSVPEIIGIFYQRKEGKNEFTLNKDTWYLILDEIQDPGNLGTIIRTCDWFGVYEIFASPHTADIYNPKVVQSTMGSLARVKVHYLDLKELINKHRDFKVVGTLLDGKNFEDTKLPEGGFLLMGNEGKGISEELKREIDLPLTIPPVNPVSHPDSLNVAIATAIILSKIR